MTTFDPIIDLDFPEFDLEVRTVSVDSDRMSPTATSPTASSSDSRVTSTDHIAMQFFWQGYEVYTHSRANDSIVPCYYKSQCGCTQSSGDAELMRIVPVDELRERSILDEMKVQIVSVNTGRYLRATRVSKYLRWSETRDEQTVFQIQILDRTKPLTRETKFVLASAFWPGQYVGFTQHCPLGAGRDVSKAIGFLTIEKKKSQAPLIFPLRFRAVHHATRFSRRTRSLHTFDEPVPFVTTNELLFIDDDDGAITQIPVATLLSPEEVSPQTDHAIDALCPYCTMRFHRRDALFSHIRDTHGDWLHRRPVPGAFCTRCGHRRVQGACRRCDEAAAETDHP